MVAEANRWCTQFEEPQKENQLFYFTNEGNGCNKLCPVQRPANRYIVQCYCGSGRARTRKGNDQNYE